MEIASFGNELSYHTRRSSRMPSTVSVVISPRLNGGTCQWILAMSQSAPSDHSETLSFKAALAWYGASATDFSFEARYASVNVGI